MAKRVNKRFLIILTAVVVVGAVAGMAGTYVMQRLVKKDPKVFIAEAERHEAAGDIDAAIGSYAAAAGADQRNPEVLVKLGNLLYRQVVADPQNFLKARQAWEQALAVDPGYRPAMDALLDSHWEVLNVQPGAPSIKGVRDSAERILASDPKNKTALARFHIATIRQAALNIPTKAADIEKAIAALRELSKQDPADADLVSWAAQGDLYLATSAIARVTDVDEAKEKLVKLEQTLDGALKGQEANAAMQLRVAQVLTHLASVEKAAEDVAGGGPAPTTGPTTRPMAGRFPAGQPAGRLTDRVTAGLAAAREHVKPTDEVYVDVFAVSADWFRALGKRDDVIKTIDELAKNRGDDPSVRLVYARAFQGDVSKRDKVMEMLSRKVDYSAASGVKAMRLREMESALKVELANLRIIGLEREADPAKRKQVIDSVLEEIKRLELVAGPQSPPLLELKGRILLLQGKALEAITVLQQAVDRNPESRPNLEARFQLAMAYAATNQTGQAERLLRTVVAKVPDHMPSRVAWVRALHANGQFGDARDELAKLKKEQPAAKEIAELEAVIVGGEKRQEFVQQLPENTAAERIRKAMALRGEGKIDEAIDLAAATFKDDPKYAPAIEQLISMYMQLGRRDDAIALVKEAMKANPENKHLAALPDMLARRTPAEIEEWQLGRLKMEKDPVKRALGMHAFQLQKANAATAARDDAARKTAVAEAEKHIAEAEAQAPDDNRVLSARFEFMLTQRKFDELAPVLKKLTAMNVDEAGGNFLRFRVALAKNDLGAAEAAARELTRQRPQFADGWQFLGQALQAQSRFREAAAAFAAALERQGRNYEALKGMVLAQVALGDNEEAKQYLDRAAAMYPNDVSLREMSLTYEMTHGDPRKVIAARERLAKAQPENVDNALLLAESYLRAMASTNDPKQINEWADKSRKVLEAGIKKWPTNARFLVHLARVRQAQGDFIGGEKVLKDYAARDDVQDKAAADVLLAEYYTAGNKPALAEQSFRDALEKARGTDKEGGIKQQLAALQAATNRLPEAIKTLDGVTTPGAARQRVGLLNAAGKRDEAEAAVKEAIAANPNSQELSNLQLEMFIDNGRIGDAEAVVRERLSKNDADENARYYGALAKLRKNPPDAAGAVKELVSLSEKFPRNVKVLALLGEAYATSGERGSAIDALDRALQVQPMERDIRAKLVDWCAQAGRWDAVIKIAGEAMRTPRLANDPAWPQALANAYAATGKHAEAEKHIAIAQRMVPADSPAAVEIERAYLNILGQARNYQKILQVTDAWIAKGRKDWWIYQFRGLARGGMKDKNAVKEFETALAGLDPNKQFGQASAIVRTIAQAAGPDAALARIEKWEAENPRWRIVAAELCMGKDDGAAGVAHLQPLEADADKLPKDLRAQFYRTLGTCYHMSRPRPDMTKAAEAYKKYLELNPIDVMALNNLAYVLAEEMTPPRPADAKIYSQKAYEIAREWKAGDGKSRILDTHGWILVLTGGSGIDEGIRILEEAVDEAPIVEAHYHLGEAHIRKKRADEAVEQLNLALGMIEKAKQKKAGYDEILESRIQRALTTAKGMTSAAGAR